MEEGEETIVDKSQEESGGEESTEETEETTSQDTQDQDESSNDKLDQLKDKAPDHLLKDDGSINEEEVLKQNLGFRKKQSQGELEEAIEFYDEYGDKIDEIQGNSQEEETEETEETETDEETEQDDDNEIDEDATDIPEDPSEYDVSDIVEGKEDNEVYDDVTQSAKEAAHEAGLTQEQFETMMGKWEESVQSQVDEIDPDEEFNKISDNKQEAKKIVNQVASYLEKKHEDGYLNDSEYQEALFMAETAEGISVLRKLMNKNQEATDIPTDAQSVGEESIQDKKQKLQELRKHEAYKDQHHPEHEKIVNKINSLTQEVVDAREG